MSNDLDPQETELTLLIAEWYRSDSDSRGVPSWARHLAKYLLEKGYSLNCEPLTGDDFSEAVLAERMRHAGKGYDDAHDNEHGIEHLLDWAMDYAKRGEHVKAMSLVLAAKDSLSAPDAEQKENRNLLSTERGDRAREVLARWLPYEGQEAENAAWNMWNYLNVNKDFTDAIVHLHAPEPDGENPVDTLAQIIRRVDGNHDMGAGRLAQALIDAGIKVQS